MKAILRNSLLLISCVLILATNSFGQTNWTNYAGNPVTNSSFDPTVTGKYDPMVILDGGTYKMWYTREFDAVEKIGYATSPDGISWTLGDTANLVPSTGNTRFDCIKVGQGSVLKDGNTYKMWYWGHGPNIGNIGYATSTNGTVWTKVDGSNSDKSVYNRTADGSGALALTAPSVVKSGNTYHMWYMRYGSVFRIAYATSPDGINWTNVPGNGTLGAVIDLGSTGAFDDALVGFPCVQATDTGFEMWYAAVGSTVAGTSVGYATSTNGSTWIKSGSCLPNGGTPAVIKDNSKKATRDHP